MMNESPETLPAPSPGAEFLRRQSRESQLNHKVGHSLVWMSLVVYLLTVVVTVGFVFIIGQVGPKDLSALFAICLIWCQAILGVGCSMLLSFVGSFYCREAILLFLFEFVTVFFLLFFPIVSVA